MEGLLEKIKARGYWRINFRPRAYEGDLVALTKAKELVEKSTVQFRGWDYPHFPTRNDDESGLSPCGDYYEGWVDWWNHIEFWRMYKSTQFLHYLALREDWYENSKWEAELAKNKQPFTSLGVGGTIYQITEIFEFAFRLGRLGLYQKGLTVDIKLENTQGRALWIDDPRRLPFSFPRKTGAPFIHLKRELPADDVISANHDVSLDALLELFENFEWSPPRDLIKTQQEQVRSGRY